MRQILYAAAEVTFEEVPDEVSLCISIPGCDNFCKGCHSPWMAIREGAVLDVKVLIEKYEGMFTTICFFGGETEEAFPALLDEVANDYPDIKIAMYSGKNVLSADIQKNLDYMKLGPYEEESGPLTSRITNQQMFEKVNGIWVDITFKFWKSIGAQEAFYDINDLGGSNE